MAILDVACRLRSGELNLISYLADLCDRIESREAEIQALVPGTFDRSRISGEASKLLIQYPDPASRPPLFGVPVGIKDIFRVDGFPTRCGAKLPPHLFDGPEATSVSRLKAAGAIVTAKTVTTEFAWMEPGPTRNPYHLEHTPGGSSSGSAAGVAAGFFPFALGTQTAGSTIRPAAYCGIVGLKPSFDRISTAGVIPFSPSADHVGIFCPDPSGLSLLMSVLAEGWMPSSRQSPQRGKALVLGVPDGPYLAQASSNALQHFRKHLAKLQDAGHLIKHVSTFPQVEEVNERHMKMITAEMARVHSQWFKDFSSLYRPRTVQTIEKGRKMPVRELEILRAGRLLLRKEIEEKMESEQLDLWIAPSTTDHAPRGLESTGSPVMNIPWTYAGLPTVSLPAGLNEANLPLGIQIVGRFWKDEDLVASAEALFSALRSSP